MLGSGSGQKGHQNLLHYLDDFIFVSKSGEVTAAYKQTLLDTCSLGSSPRTPEGPVTCLTFLGIEVDSRTLQLRLPNDKLHHLKDQLAAAVSKRCMTQHKLKA